MEQFDSQKQYDSIGCQAAADEKQKFLARTYGWMALALAISAAIAFFTSQSITLLRLIFGNPFNFWIIAIGELALVWWLSASIQKISVTAATVAFIAYSLLNGLTLSAIFIAYTRTTIAYTFLASAGMFGAMALYGKIGRASCRERV